MSFNTIHPLAHKNHTTSRRYGITEAKKAELDALTLQVLDAQHNVEMYQSIVDALNEKYSNFQNLLTTADATRTQAFSNKNQMAQLAQYSHDLMGNSNTAFDEVEVADKSIKKMAVDVKLLMERLIYSVELINKLATVVIRKKALNPLISDELISMVGTAGNDANNVVALTLVALKATFAAQASVMESSSAIELGYVQSQELYYLLTGTTSSGKKANKASLLDMLNKAYVNSKSNYAYMEKAVAITNKQLNDAKTDLSKAQISLKSLQSGLAAANAAALAS